MDWIVYNGNSSQLHYNHKKVFMKSLLQYRHNILPTNFVIKLYLLRDKKLLCLNIKTTSCWVMAMEVVQWYEKYINMNNWRLGIVIILRLIHVLYITRICKILQLDQYIFMSLKYHKTNHPIIKCSFNGVAIWPSLWIPFVFE